MRLLRCYLLLDESLAIHGSDGGLLTNWQLRSAEQRQLYDSGSTSARRHQHNATEWNSIQFSTSSAVDYWTIVPSDV